MIDSIVSFFKEKVIPADNDKEVSQVHTAKVAACAILLEVANADNEFTEDETASIYKALSHLYGLDYKEIKELIDIANRQNKEAIDLWQFTNLINQYYTLEQKMLLMEHIWRVILSDNTLDKFEDYLARKLKSLLRLSHEEWVETKMRAKKIRS